MARVHQVLPLGVVSPAFPCDSVCLEGWLALQIVEVSLVSILLSCFALATLH